MNADAYLRKQGWKGSGHSLDSTGRGIKRPLLIAHKQDQLGLGKKKAAYTTDDQWWMRAYDQSLQSIGTGKESTLNQIRTQGINRGGLYGFFVKGEAIAGTIEDSSATDTSLPPSGTSTPLTSASDTEAPTLNAKMSIKEKKRKRAFTNSPDASKRTKAAQQVSGKGKDQSGIVAKLAKLKPSERAEYETRAAAKQQTLEEYVLRRIQKKAEKRATKYVESFEPSLFFTNLPGEPIPLTIAQATLIIPHVIPRRTKSKTYSLKKGDNEDIDTFSETQRARYQHVTSSMISQTRERDVVP
ncbi:hypothetical protein BKA66DRAFT_411041 [Pyrenochaeta sp. MPI-SDFR-AT-0127]|nr:hypothetical protein BKA66DRAFT_411041 [Pyrenochaeta sp. MPI-SDFR-AT-0127]